MRHGGANIPSPARLFDPRAVLGLAVLCVVLGCRSAPTAPHWHSYDGDWPVSTPAEEGVDSVRLASLDSAILAGEYRNIRSLLVVRHGALLFERYYRGYDRDSLQPVFSVTESFVSALVGIALGRGEINGLDGTVHDLLPVYQTGVPWDAQRRAITLRHLLTMTSGLVWIESEVPFDDPANSYTAMTASGDWIDFVLRVPMDGSPGDRWRYCTGCSVLAGAILERATGVHAEEYATRFLFGALGIGRYRWERAPGGMNNGGFGLELRPRDLAKFGQLYLRRGVWGGGRVVPESWVSQSTSMLVPHSDTLGYGLHWWVYRPSARTARGRTAGTVAVAWGLGDKFIFVLPELDMVVVSTAANYPGVQAQAFRFLNSHLIPATR